MKAVQPPRGMRDVLPEDYFQREALITVIRQTYEKYGYVPIDTPAMENVEILTGKSGEDTEKLMFKILKRGAKLEDGAMGDPADLALRFDFTLSLCRFYATNYHRLPAIFRRYQIGPVWRAERPQHGRFREFYQCDVDIIGEASHLAESEVILATDEALQKAGLKDYFVKLSDRRLLPIILGRIGLSIDQIGMAMVSIDKLDKIGCEAVLEEMRAYLTGDPLANVEEFMRHITENPNPSLEPSSLGPWGEQCAADIEPVLDNLRNIQRTVASACERPIRVLFSPALVRGMAYYTGPIFEVWDSEHPFSLAGGGRYDGVIGLFLGRDIPACGFSIGFERLLTVLKEKGILEVRRTRARVLVAAPEGSLVETAFRIGQRLREAGIPTEVYLSPAKLKKQFKHVEQQGIRWIVVPHGPEGSGSDYELRDVCHRRSVNLKWPDLLAAVSSSEWTE